MFSEVYMILIEIFTPFKKDSSSEKEMHPSWNTTRTKLDVKKIHSVICSSKNGISTRKDAENFLLTEKNSKNYTDRYISWMLMLNILNPSKDSWADYICQLCSKYESFLNSKLVENPSDPLLALSDEQESQIQNDLRRTIRFFNDLAKSANLPYIKQNGVLFRVARVLTMMNLTESKFTYIQGCERYVYICYLISILFTTENDLPDMIAEASAYYLATKMIELSGISHYLSDPTRLENHFRELDQKMYQINPNLMNYLSKQMQTSIHFALRWEILLFAEEHDYAGIITLWDRIICHKTAMQQYIEALCLAHFAQVPICKLGQLQHYKNWNMQKLIADADKFMDPNTNLFGWGKAAMLFLAVGVVTAAKYISNCI